MGNNAKKKVRSLPPLGKESKSRGKKKPEVSFQQVTNGQVVILTTFCQGLDVQIPDRQRLIGSPAPQSMRNKIRQQKTFKKVRIILLIKIINFVNSVELLLGIPHHHALRLRG